MLLNLGERFDRISEQMQHNFSDIRESIKHRGEKGRSIEEILRQFLKVYFPKSLDVSTGFIIDSNGNESKQMDVILSDSAKTPVFYDDSVTRVLPVECVYSVIEVKSMLDSNSLDQCVENMKSVRRLEKKAYTRPPPYDEFSVSVYGSTWPIRPVHYFLFAFDSIDLDGLVSMMDQKYSKENLGVSSRIDTTCVLHKGVICNLYPNGEIGGLPQSDSRISDSRILNVYTNRALLLFYLLISSHLFQAQMPFFQLHEYAKKINF
jgi:hypothetical protein